MTVALTLADTGNPRDVSNDRRRAIPARNAFMMSNMLSEITRSGTAQRARRELKRADLFGKTGTTNDQRDAWFNGYNQSMVTNVWVGFDSNKKLGRREFGSRAALPAWVDYMRVALEGEADKSPSLPEGMLTVRIDPKTGLRAPAGMQGAIFELFR